MTRARRTGSVVLILAAIFGVALALRLWGISFGLPYRYHPDEPQHVVEAARMLADRRIEPEIFNNPPFYKYVLMAADSGWFAGQILLSAERSPETIIADLESNPAPLYLLGRIVSAISGTLTVLIVFQLGTVAYDRRVGLLAAGFLAVAFLHVRESHYAVNDALLTLLTSFAVLQSIMVLREGKPLHYLLGGASAGLAFATKYTAALVLVPLLGAHLLAPRYRGSEPGLRVGRLVGMGSSAGLAAALGSPYFILKPATVFQSVQSSIAAYGRYGFEGWQIDPAGGYLYYLKSLLWGLGPGLFVLAMVGIGLALWRRSSVEWLLLSMPLAVYAFMGSQQMYFARFLLPVVPVLMVLAAFAADRISDRVARTATWLRGSSLGAPTTMMAAIGVVALIPSLAASVRHDQLLTRTDTRTLAKEWFELHIPSGATVAVDWPHHGPPLRTEARAGGSLESIYDVLEVGGQGLAEHSLEEYRAMGIQYLVTSSNLVNLQLRNESSAEERKAFYGSLETELELVYAITPSNGTGQTPFIFDEVYGPAVGLWRRALPGPEIRVYRLDSPGVTH